MGAGNVSLVSINYASVPGNAFKILVKMALICLDSDVKPRWWGGDGILLSALGRVNPPDEDDSEEAKAVRHANGVALRAAVNDLVKAGAATYAVRPSRSKQAEYWLHWEPQGKPAVRAGKACGSAVEPQGKPAVRAGKPCSSRRKTAGQQAKTAPHEDIGGLETKNKEGNNSPQVSTSPAPVDKSADLDVIRGSDERPAEPDAAAPTQTDPRANYLAACRASLRNAKTGTLQ
jgi:hypothetical protein